MGSSCEGLFLSAVTVAEGDNERGLLFGDVARACAQKAFDPIESVCKETRLYILIYIDFFSLIEWGGNTGWLACFCDVMEPHRSCV